MNIEITYAPIDSMWNDRLQALLDEWCMHATIYNDFDPDEMCKEELLECHESFERMGQIEASLSPTEFDMFMDRIPD